MIRDVIRRRVYPDIEVAGGARTAVVREGIRTDDQETGVSVA